MSGHIVIVMGSNNSSMMVARQNSNLVVGEHYNTTGIPRRWTKLKCVSHLDALVEKKSQKTGQRHWMNPACVTYQDLRQVGVDESKECDSYDDIKQNTSVDSTKVPKNIDGDLDQQVHVVKSKVADDFMRDKCVCEEQEQSALSPASGEGHCSGACAFIPQDLSPTIMRAYEESDFDHVDTTPVRLPMLDDDGVLRRPSPTSTSENK